MRSKRRGRGRRWARIALFLALIGLSAGCASVPEPELGIWDAHLQSPGGELSFLLELARTPDGELLAWVVNATERTAVPRATLDGSTLTLGFPHYDSTIVAELLDEDTLRGEWVKQRGNAPATRMGFAASAGFNPFSPYLPPPMTTVAGPGPAALEGRWRVQLSSSPAVAVGVFGLCPETSEYRYPSTGTILTTTGDYRYLHGYTSWPRLTLSCFDGAHAFLFTATATDDDHLEGEFWSGDRWHETWTAVRDPEASLPDPFTLTRWNDGVPLDDLVFPDLEGTPRSLGDAEFAGRARIIQLFGSWCPNCHDAAVLLSELDRRYSDRGLSIIGLAFEPSDDAGRNVRQVQRYRERHGTQYPTLIAGPADKARATVAFGALDEVRAYPTTIFVDRDGDVRAIHTGFSGPATGEEHERLKRKFVSLVEELLSE